jgi:hypothetical protein
VFIYLTLYSADSVAKVFRVFDPIRDFCKPVSHAVTQAFAGAVLHLEIQTYTSYSDDLYNYVQCVLFGLLATGITAIWSLVQPRKREHNRLYAWFRLMMQIQVGATVLSYGMAKVVPCQFPPLDALTLSKPVGDYSPHSLLWAVMGYSQLYTIFGGVTEVVGAFLLMLPRTYLAGALLTFAVMVNVLLFNLSYDIGVKLLSMHLLAGAAVVFLPDLKGLVQSLLLRKQFQPVSFAPFFRNGRLNSLILVGQVVLALFWTVDQVNYALHRYERQNAGHAHMEDGLWIVEKQTIDGQEPTLSDDESLRWGRLALAKEKLVVQNTVGNRDEFSLDRNKVPIAINLANRSLGDFAFQSNGDDGKHASVRVTFKGHQIWCQLRPVRLDQLPLTSAPFRWVSQR